LDARIASYAELAVYPTATFVPPPRGDIATKIEKHAPAAAGRMMESDSHLTFVQNF
jgi:hypothetical protein